jgi:hypothetical protein
MDTQLSKIKRPLLPILPITPVSGKRVAPLQCSRLASRAEFQNYFRVVITVWGASTARRILGGGSR